MCLKAQRRLKQATHSVPQTLSGRGVQLPVPPTMADDEEEVSTDTVSFLIVAGSLVQASKAIRDAITENGFQVRGWARRGSGDRMCCRARGNQAPSRSPPSLFPHMFYNRFARRDAGACTWP